MVTTNDTDFTQNPKSEINSLEYEVDGESFDEESQSAINEDYDSTSVRRSSKDEYEVLNELLYEKQVKSEETAVRPKPAVPVTPFVTQQTPQGHSLDIFFRAMCATVKTFPNADIAEIKLKISQIVGTKEIEIMNRPHSVNL